MKKTSQVSLIFLFIAVMIVTGCSGIRLTPGEREIIQEAVDNIKRIEENIHALRIMEAEKTYPEEFVKIRDEFARAKAIVPESLLKQDIPTARVTISQEEKEHIINTVPLFQKSAQESERLVEHIATSKMRQIEKNLEVIWNVEDRVLYCFQAYVKAHNMFLKARKRYPSPEPPPTMKYSDSLVEFDAQTGLIPLGEQIPGEIRVGEAAEYIEKSDAICQKIVSQYLINPDTFPHSCPGELAVTLPTYSEIPGESAYRQEQQDLQKEEYAATLSAKLEQAFDNLDLIWGTDGYHSEAYAASHNAFIEAYKRLPFFEPFPVIMPPEYGARYVEFDPEKHELVLVGEPMEPLENPDHTEAEYYATQSYDMSQQILARYYLEKFHRKAETVREELRKAIDREPDSALGDFIPKIDEILDYADNVQENPLLIDITQVIKTKNTLEETEFLIQFEQSMRQTLKNRISFAPGQCELLEDGKKAVKVFIERLVAIKQLYTLQYPGQTIIIKIKTVGYTDGQGFSDETGFINTLPKEYQEQVPLNPLERRQFLNQQLSECRADAVKEYAQQELSTIEWGDSTIQIEFETIGKGETLPSQEQVSPPYRKKDPRRRISKISVTLRRVIPFFDQI